MNEKTRKCHICGKEKQENDYFKQKHRKDGFRVECKECTRKCATEYYRKNKEKYKIRARYFKPQSNQRRREYIDTIKIKYGCQLCGIKEIVVLDFHHVSDKDFSINCSDGCSMKKLVKEINKCVVLCGNCHRKVHAKIKLVSENMICKEEIPATKNKKERHIYRWD